MTLEPYIGNPNNALGGRISSVQLYISTTLLSAGGRWRGGSVEVDRTHGKCELSAVKDEKGRCRIAWTVDQGEVL
jgi:hypothetical protein